MTALKTRPQRQPIAEFIRGIEDPKIRSNCDTLRKLMARVTGKRAVIWDSAIVGFGRYQYKYYVDGQWVVDPENPLRIVTETGIVNSLIKVK